MSDERFLESTSRRTNQALSETRPYTLPADLRDGLRKGFIDTVGEGGLYTVSLRGEGGINTTLLQFVDVWPEDPGFDEGDAVLVLIDKAQNQASIIETGGGSGECEDCLTNYGMVTGS